MPPVNKNKTYSRPNKRVAKHSVNAVNELFAKNMTKRTISKNRKKRNFLIKELPPRCETVLAEDSFEISTEDTFDKLLTKGKNECPEYKVDNNSSTSKLRKTGKLRSSINQESTFHSPIITRTRKKKSSVEENTKSNGLISDKSKSSSNPYLYRLNIPTIDGIDVSLEIEKLPKKPQNSSSYIVLPSDLRESRKEQNTSISLNNVFTRTFRERQFIHSSTPLATQKSQKKIINHTISPIKNVSSLVKESFEEIKKWDSQFPSVSEAKYCSTKSLITEKTNESSDNSDGSFHGFSARDQSESNAEIPHGSHRKMSFITLRRRQIPKLDKEKTNYECISKSELLYNDSAVCSNTSQNPSISGNIDQSYNVQISRNRTSKSKEFQKGRKTKSDDSKKTPVSLEEFTTSGNLTISSDSQDQHIFDKKKSETSLKNTNKRKRSSVVSYSNSKSGESINFSQKTDIDDMESQKENYVNINEFNISKELFINLRRHKFNKSKSEEFRLSNSENIKSSKTDIHVNTPIFKTGRKELLVNVTMLDVNIPSELQNIPIQKSYCDSDLADEKTKQLVVNVTKNNFEDYTSKNLNSDNEGESTAIVNSASLVDYDKKHNSISLMENSFLKPKRIYQSRPCLPSSLASSHEDISFVDLSESLNESSKYTIPQGSATSQRIQTNPDSSDIVESSILESSENHNIFKHTNLQNNDVSQSIQIIPDSSDIVGSSILESSENHDIFQHTNLQNNAVSQSIQIIPDSSDIIESTILESSKNDDIFKVPLIKKAPAKPLLLKAGKSWRRSLSTYKRTSILPSSVKEEKNIFENETIARHIEHISKNNRFSIRIVPVEASPISKPKRKFSILEDYAVKLNGYVPDQSLDGNLENSLRCLSLRKTDNLVRDSIPVTAKEVVLRRCGQAEPILFSECYPQSALQHCQKIGEGVYGEVFLYRNPAGGTSVMKVIPIEGNQIVNGERQKKFEEILSEIIIAMELSNLRNNKKNATSTFSLVQKIHCVQGQYPEKLLDLWDLYDESRGSENDCPDFFTSDQLYIVLQLENAGQDLEAFLFTNAQQVYSMLKQVAFGLAVAEEQLRFEHRDLHWGNILVSTVDKRKVIDFYLNGAKYSIPSTGVQATIIDFTLSRIEHDGVVIFNDLGADPDLFTAEGDYQFEVYRLMQKKNENNWQDFEPYSNLLWLHYILDKAVTAVRYKNTSSKTHKDHLLKMTQLSEEILTYKSVKDFVLNSQL